VSITYLPSRVTGFMNCKVEDKLKIHKEKREVEPGFLLILGYL